MSMSLSLINEELNVFVDFYKDALDGGGGVSTLLYPNLHICATDCRLVE